jgi:hypothetical protein
MKISKAVLSWVQWQCEVVALLREDLRDVLSFVSLDDVDWLLWRDFYLQGRTPRAAINRALERDL